MKWTSRASRLRGRRANERGRSNEALVLDACQLPSRPPWMRTARSLESALAEVVGEVGKVRRRLIFW